MLTYINGNGDSIELGNDIYKIIEFDGRGGAEGTVQSQKSPFQDGASFIETMLDIRDMAIELKITDDSYEKRALLSKVFNPKSGEGELRYRSGGYERIIDCVVESSPTFPKANVYQRCQIVLLALNPYWHTPSITEEPTFEPLFEFPFEGTFEMGVQRDERIIDNDGDAPAPIQVEFHGPAVNPIITNNTTGQYIKVNQTLGEDEIMKIDTTPGKKSVVFVGSDGTERNVFNWIDLESTFFQLQLGENNIQYSADSDIQGAIVNIYYQKRFIGV